jgi:site-specific recombinase XerD
LGEFTPAKRPRKIPVVLTRSEVDRLFGCMSGEHRLMARLLYGSGLRLMDCVRLRIKDVDFERRQIVVRDGKGMKDRVTMLPEGLRGELEEHLKGVKTRYEEDLRAGHGEVYLPEALSGNGYDIRTVQELLGHDNVETTQIYTHVMQKPGLGVKSPLDG